MSWRIFAIVEPELLRMRRQTDGGTSDGEAGLNLRPHDRGRIFIPGRNLIRIRIGIRVATQTQAVAKSR
jgi:hypothetical protein